MLNTGLNIYVNRDLCYACGTCVERCILDNLRLSLAPCRTACPLHMNCQGYIRLIAQGKERQAAEELRKYTPFGGILGRICTHPCEDVCERQSAEDGAVHIRALKRYLADSYPDVASSLPAIPKETSRHAAIVGSGPAGLMAAYELKSKGHRVTLFDSASEPGGMLRYGIPDFRLPVQEIDQAVKMLERMGVQIKTGETIGKTVAFDELERRFDAVVLAIGAGAPVRLGIPGEDLAGVMQAQMFIKQIKERTSPQLGESVVVIGGGNTAIDAALVCRKMGVSDVRIVCLESCAEEMPAFDRELQEAREEEIKIENKWGPTQIIKLKNDKLRIEFSECLALFDDQGHFCPTLGKSCGLALEADSIILGTGQRVCKEGLPDCLLDSETGNFAADPLTLQSASYQKVFLCGDLLSGPSSVVLAMASAQEAALSADRFMRGEGMKWGRDFWNEKGYLKEYQIEIPRTRGNRRGDLVRVPTIHRTLKNEIEKVLTPQQANAEAQRCLSCGQAVEANQTCWSCLPCEIECPVDALQVRMPYQIR